MTDCFPLGCRTRWTPYAPTAVAPAAPATAIQPPAASSTTPPTPAATAPVTASMCLADSCGFGVSCFSSSVTSYLLWSGGYECTLLCGFVTSSAKL
jgi:hypothetical protein